MVAAATTAHAAGKLPIGPTTEPAGNGTGCPHGIIVDLVLGLVGALLGGFLLLSLIHI